MTCCNGDSWWPADRLILCMPPPPATPERPRATAASRVSRHRSAPRHASMNPRRCWKASSLTPDQTGLLNKLVTLMQIKAPEALLPLENVIIVGSNYEVGGEFPTSNKAAGRPLRRELVFGPCVITDPNYLSQHFYRVQRYERLLHRHIDGDPASRGLGRLSLESQPALDSHGNS